MAKTGFIADMPYRALALAFLFASTSSNALAGEMGPADIQNRNDMQVVTELKAMCVGALDKWEGEECTLTLSPGRITINGSSGIQRNQIKGLSFSSGYAQQRKFFDLLYTDRSGKLGIAQFAFAKGNMAKQFMNSFLIIMNQD
jgi:hypothetical protein